MNRNAFYWFVLVTLPLLVGCEGCRPTPAIDPNAEGEKAPREAYSTEPVRVYPADQNASFGSAKPGHWMTAEQSIRSNQDDTRGELVTRSAVSVKNLDLEVTGSIDGGEAVRPVVLPKGQMRRFDFRFRCPVPNTVQTRRFNLYSKLLPRSGGVMETGGQPIKLMQGHEYFFVVLTNRPEQFTRLQVANWASTSETDIDKPLETNNYRIVVPDASELMPMPETVLDMTSIAVILWDDLSEDALTPAQQTAIADWVRFGGRFIVNGASASDAVVNTSLSDLLPLIPTSNIELDGDAAADLIRHWAVETDRSSTKQIEYVKSENSRIAVDGQLQPGAVAVEGTSKLVLSRRAGLGVVVQPRFDLTDDWIGSWDSYDSFVNSVILNRPPRAYLGPKDDIGELDSIPLYFAGTKIRTDSAVNTQFRLATRDSILGRLDGDGESKSGSRFDRLTRIDGVTGIAAWNDQSDAIKQMQETLTQEAGIEIPGSDLVIRSLMWYLIVLVPVNYIVFRLMNRLEYAWFAVPVIAIIGAVWAARQARLDIGFARSTTELALLETHGGYPRGHLTRIIGVYNSLSSRYEFQFRTVDGIASTLEGEPDPGTALSPIWKTSYEEGPSLDDFAVSSNRMRYAHTEEVVDVGGGFVFEGETTLASAASFDLLDALLVRKSADGQVSVASVGDLEGGSEIELEFRSGDRLPIASELPMQTEQLIRRFASPESMHDGSCRLVGRIEGSLDGLAITPSASQTKAQTIALIHLEYAATREPKKDKNLIQDFVRVNRFDGKTEDLKDAEDVGENQDSIGL